MQVTKNLSVLIADDSEDIRALLRYWLEAKRCRVVEAINGQEALDLTRSEHPDVILMDLFMPVLDGVDAARRIREYFGANDLYIVAMSSHPTEAARTTALAAGCSSFIAQPFNFDQLDDLLCHVLPVPAGH